VAIDNIAAAANNFSPLLTTVGFGVLIGFLIGFAIKKVMKILAIGAGIFFAALMYLESQNIVNINWDNCISKCYIYTYKCSRTIPAYVHHYNIVRTLHFQ
jgi:uncharacterized membrane protein (Fun14 family)